MVEERVVDLNTDANVTIILGNYEPLILAPKENLYIYKLLFNGKVLLHAGLTLLIVH